MAEFLHGLAAGGETDLASLDALIDDAVRNFIASFKSDCGLA
jgi:hypothetical protein